MLKKYVQDVAEGLQGLQVEKMSKVCSKIPKERKFVNLLSISRVLTERSIAQALGDASRKMLYLYQFFQFWSELLENILEKCIYRNK